jgi:hypothetical protein
MDISASSITFSSKHLQTSTFCRLNSMDHKGSVSFLIFSLGVNRLFHRSRNSYLTTKPHKNDLNNFTWFLLEIWQGFKARLVKVIYSIIQYPLPKNLGAPTTMARTLSLGWNKLLIHHLKTPKGITHELPHNHFKNPWHNHLLPCVGPYRKTYQTSRPYPDLA